MLFTGSLQRLRRVHSLADAEPADRQRRREHRRPQQGQSRTGCRRRFSGSPACARRHRNRALPSTNRSRPARTGTIGEPGGALHVVAGVHPVAPTIGLQRKRMLPTTQPSPHEQLLDRASTDRNLQFGTPPWSGTWTRMTSGDLPSPEPAGGDPGASVGRRRVGRSQQARGMARCPVRAQVLLRPEVPWCIAAITPDSHSASGREPSVPGCSCEAHRSNLTVGERTGATRQSSRAEWSIPVVRKDFGAGFQAWLVDGLGQRRER
ncbi:hypothetical protein A8926_6170 [Saccharopolyspora spinosa]|uniref:Uncharacterized protein n=1 Tax=Saccharopolyspora spinosa TaxID=60894 RepID=A0A2N3Y5A8_SACSN|nr:hypothetical protein A8926_6170 [Saccharopolyspora spinosa]